MAELALDITHSLFYYATSDHPFWHPQTLVYKDLNIYIFFFIFFITF